MSNVFILTATLTFVGYLQQEVDMMAMETKLRGFIRELIEPMATKSKVDREMIFHLEKVDDDFEKRIDLLEQAVYKKDRKTGAPTLFDRMEEQLIQLSAELKTRTTELKGELTIAQQESRDTFFLHSQRLTSIEAQKEAIINNKNAIAALQKLHTDTTEDLRKSVEDYGHKSLQETNRIDMELTNINNVCNDVTSRVADCESMSKRAEFLANDLFEQVKEVTKSNIALNRDKVDVLEYRLYLDKDNRRKLDFENAVDDLKAKITEMQNWLDVYFPLRIQH